MGESIVFFDIDGTLIDKGKQIPKSTKEAIFQLKERGHHVAIATGRAPFMFEAIRNELDIHTYVSFNGQLVVVDDHIVYKNPLNKEVLQLITHLAIENDHPIVHVGQYEMKANVYPHDYITGSLDTLKVTELVGHNPDYHKETDIFQSMLFLKEKEEKPYEQKFKELKFLRWHPLSVDIDPAGSSKAEGIKIVMEKLGLSIQHLYAFGDDLNDIEMLSLSPHSVAMGNAHPLAKNAAKYITKPVNEDGIKYGLKMVGLL